MIEEAKTLKEKVALLIVERMESGEKMPTEKEMVKQFGVSRTALREVLSIFEASGIITSLQGSGRYVQAPNFGAQIVDTWSILLWARPAMLLELLEVRSILEVNSLAQAMTGITMEQLQLLNIQVSKMKEKASLGKSFASNDREFHRILYTSTNNSLLEQLLTTFWDLYEAAKVETVHGQLGTLAQQHEDILKAFAKQDLEMVTSLMKEQFTDARYRIVVALMNKDDTKRAIETAKAASGEDRPASVPAERPEEVPVPSPT